MGSGAWITFSTQIGYRATPWVNPPAGASLVVVVVAFDSPVTLDGASSFGSWTPDPAAGSTGTTFVFTKTPPSVGDGLTFNVIGSDPGALRSTATMSLINGGTTTWASESSSQTVSLVA
ncbi:hypothetical protein [Microbacterium sp. LWO12-1.2]|uniref:hypothetical protein n=1 Tax=Microbacterium sp. LWO12-1.2 TaxID=3135261 RepID=UPI00342D5354